MNPMTDTTPDRIARRQRLADLKTRSLETGRLDDRAAYLLAALDEDDESEREKRAAKDSPCMAGEEPPR